MKLKVSLFFLTLAALFTIYVFKGGYFSSTSEPRVTTVAAKSFSSVDLINKLEKSDLRDYQGNKLSIPVSSLSGRGGLFVHFWASWCSPCVGEVPELVAYAKAHPQYTYVIVSLDEYQDDIAKFMKSFPEFNSKQFIKIWDGDKQLSKFVNVDLLPMTLVLRKEKLEPQVVKSVLNWKGFVL